MSLSEYIYIEPDDLNFFPLLLLMFFYGNILVYAANLVAEGAEMLLLVPSLRDIVGSIILPLFGALPDAAIIFFSCLGDDVNSNMKVGVGALAGSTVLLITIPLYIVIVVGRVDIINGKLQYAKPKNKEEWSKLTNKGICNQNALFYSGIPILPSIKFAAYVMCFTSIPYIIMQIPAWSIENDDDETISTDENIYALISFILALILLIAYLYISMKDEDSDGKKKQKAEAIKDGIKSGKITLLGAVLPLIQNATKKQKKKSNQDNDEKTAIIASVDDQSPKSVSGYGSFKDGDKLPDEAMEELKMILFSFFCKYDEDYSGTVDIVELGKVFRDLGERIHEKELALLLEKHDEDKSGTLDFEEFTQLIIVYMKGMSNKKPEDQKRKSLEKKPEKDDIEKSLLGTNDELDVSLQEEVDEMPEDFVNLSPKEQQRAILRKSFYFLFLGTILILVFSDVMVDCFDSLGDKLGVSSFYVSFLLAPIASNGSEVLAAYSHSKKKTTTTVNLAVNSLLGGVIMNNTFCLGVFLFMIYYRQLSWEFGAETIGVLFSIYAVTFYCYIKDNFTLFDSFILLSLYGVALALSGAMTAVGMS